MRFLSVLTFCLLTSMSSSNAQSSGDLSLGVSFWSGLQVYDGNQKLSKTETKNRLSTNPEALNLYNKGKGQMNSASLLGAVGGFCFGYGLGTMLNKRKEGGEILAGAGLAGIIAGGVIYGNGSGNVRTAINLYNQTRLTSLNESPFEINIINSQNGVGLGITF